MAHIAIVAPSGLINIELLQRGIKVLEQAGHTIDIMPHVCGTPNRVFSETDENRASDLIKAMTMPGIDIVICTRGGYGAVRTAQLLPRGFWSHYDGRPLVGFSDITVFHSLAAMHGHSTIHGPMIKHFALKGLDSNDIKATLEAMEGKSVKMTLNSHSLNRLGKASGTLIGGNLSILYSLRGTYADVLKNPKGKILFIEDLAEYHYHIDRMMQNLRLGGVLKKIDGLIVGQFTDMKDGSTPFGLNAYEIIAEAMKGTSCPILFGYPAGHADDVHFPLRMGKPISIDGLSIIN